MILKITITKCPTPAKEGPKKYLIGHPSTVGEAAQVLGLHPALGTGLGGKVGLMRVNNRALMALVRAYGRSFEGVALAGEG